ncbi:sugar phosphate isomerase/epimerase family protein [Brucella sp. BE17]|uniref:sugar phosphate isomerase/epimerase family protein n=1 Tax=Brucella sp. BE17 TaxID=3142977 RepID=UPI0031B9D7CE
MDLEIARRTGFDGVEASSNKIEACLAAGFSENKIREMVGHLDIPGVGFLIDVERQGSRKQELLDEAGRLITMATTVGSKGIQVITGPLNVDAVKSLKTLPGIYRGLIDLPDDEQIELTVKNVRDIADRAAEHNLTVYFEALAWTPLNTIDKQLKVIEKSGRSNVKLIVDYWHCYASGDTPERIAKIDKDLIYGVHICDSLKFDGGVPDEGVLRNVSTGEGVLNLQEWTDAVKSTGFVGWWSCELFSNRDHQDNTFKVAERLQSLMTGLVN